MIDDQEVYKACPQLRLRDQIGDVWNLIKDNAKLSDEISKHDSCRGYNFNKYIRIPGFYIDDIRDFADLLERGDTQSWQYVKDRLRDQALRTDRRAELMDVFDELSPESIDKIPVQRLEIYRDSQGRYVGGFVEGGQLSSTHVKDPIARYAEHVGMIYPELQEELLKQYERICSKSSVRQDINEKEYLERAFKENPNGNGYGNRETKLQKEGVVKDAMGLLTAVAELSPQGEEILSNRRIILLELEYVSLFTIQLAPEKAEEISRLREHIYRNHEGLLSPEVSEILDKNKTSKSESNSQEIEKTETEADQDVATRIAKNKARIKYNTIVYLINKDATN